MFNPYTFILSILNLDYEPLLTWDVYYFSRYRALSSLKHCVSLSNQFINVCEMTGEKNGFMRNIVKPGFIVTSKLQQ